MQTFKYIAWFNEVDKEDLSLVGGRGSNLGEMKKAGFPVPNGFIVTSNGYYDFVKQNNLAIKIKNLLGTNELQTRPITTIGQNSLAVNNTRKHIAEFEKQIISM